MLHTSSIKPFITHPEKIVRDEAMQYFADSFRYEDDLMDYVLQAIELYKHEEDGVALFYAKHFPQTQTTIQALFDFLEEKTPYSNMKHHAESIIVESDLSALVNFIDIFKYFSLKSQEIIELRLQLQEMTTTKLWQAWLDFITSGHGLYLNEFNSFHSRYYIKELAARADLQIEEVLRQLTIVYSDEHSGYELDFFTQLAGELRLQKAIPYLLDFLGSELDYLTEKAVEALIKIGEPIIVEQIEARFIESSWDFRLFATNVLQNIKLPESEQAIIRLLPQVKELDIQTSLAHALCMLYSVEGIPMVMELIESDYTSILVNLKESLYVNMTINGVDHPKLQQWKDEMYSTQPRDNKRIEEIRSMNLDFFNMDDSNEDEDWDSEDEDWDSEDEDWDSEDEEWGRPYGLSNNPGGKSNNNRFGFPSQVPYVNTSIIIGRNDPCSCGSGIKYKKCCGK